MNTVVPFAPRGQGGPWPLRSVRVVYTVAEVAQLLGLGRSVAYDLVRDGTIPARRLGHRWVIPKLRFDAWLADQSEDA